MQQLTTDFDGVLAASNPDLDVAELIEVVAAAFGLSAAGARDLGSERDRTFLLLDAASAPLAVAKVSNAAEDPATLDMEALAVMHAARVDPGLSLTLPWVVPGTTGEIATSRRATVERDGGTHHLRLYDVLPGRRRTDPLELTDAALGAFGEMTARVGRALRGFMHPAAVRTMLWDVQHASRTRTLTGAIGDARHRGLVERVFDRYDEVVAPTWPSLRAQVVHGDMTVDNVLTDDSGLITGIVDFGDMSHSALLIDLASLLDSLLNERRPDEMFRVARHLIGGYQRVTPLEPLELRLLGEVLAARAAVTITISSWRAAQGVEDAAFALRYNDSVAQTIATLLDVGWDEVARRFGAEVPAAGGRAALIERREAVLGPALEPLTYDEPIQMASARGAWMTDADGRRYLDAYNNVPCVGHGHPRIAEAIARQTRRLNTNLRYVHAGAIELAERLVASCPPGLDTVFFVNSGSEANDLAWRLATTFTGNRGGLCTDYGYHGISEAIAALSPETWTRGERPAWVQTWAVPDAVGGRNEDAGAFEAALGRLRDAGIAPAAAILDGVFTSDGFAIATPELVQAWVDRTHAAGGLWIADEVQGGHGRTGEAMWSFQRYGVTPDLVTLGKPMGNGYPVGAVITRSEIARSFAAETVFFSTFGGNPVAAAAANAVLDVLADERVLDRVTVAGEALRAAIRSIATRQPAIVDVRGPGLAIGVEFADAATTSAVKEGMRERGVLVGTSGRMGNVLKVRPPLAFTTAEVPTFAEALDAALGDRPTRPRPGRPEGTGSAARPGRPARRGR